MWRLFDSEDKCYNKKNSVKCHFRFFEAGSSELKLVPRVRGYFLITLHEMYRRYRCVFHSQGYNGFVLSAGGTTKMTTRNDVINEFEFNNLTLRLWLPYDCIMHV